MADLARISGVTPLHCASGKGHLEIFKYIVENVEDKNPARIDGKKSVHLAAAYVRLDFVKHIIKNLEDKTPRSRSQTT